MDAVYVLNPDEMEGVIASQKAALARWQGSGQGQEGSGESPEHLCCIGLKEDTMKVVESSEGAGELGSSEQPRDWECFLYVILSYSSDQPRDWGCFLYVTLRVSVLWFRVRRCSDLDLYVSLGPLLR